MWKIINNGTIPEWIRNALRIAMQREYDETATRQRLEINEYPGGTEVEVGIGVEVGIDLRSESSQDRD